MRETVVVDQILKYPFQPSTHIALGFFLPEDYSLLLL